MGCLTCHAQLQRWEAKQEYEEIKDHKQRRTKKDFSLKAKKGRSPKQFLSREAYLQHYKTILLNLAKEVTEQTGVDIIPAVEQGWSFTLSRNSFPDTIRPKNNRCRDTQNPGVYAKQRNEQFATVAEQVSRLMAASDLNHTEIVCNTANMSSELIPVWYSTKDLLAEVKKSGHQLPAGVSPPKLAAILTLYANGSLETIEDLKQKIAAAHS